MNQTPLLLRYKLRRCWQCDEIDSDFNNCQLIGEWTSYEEPKQELWALQLPGGNDFINKPNTNILHFHRYEYYAAGDPNPVVIAFDQASSDTSMNAIRSYRLPDDYTGYDTYWYNNDVRAAVNGRRAYLFIIDEFPI